MTSKIRFISVSHHSSILTHVLLLFLFHQRFNHQLVESSETKLIECFNTTDGSSEECLLRSTLLKSLAKLSGRSWMKPFKLIKFNPNLQTTEEEYDSGFGTNNDDSSSSDGIQEDSSSRSISVSSLASLFGKRMNRQLEKYAVKISLPPPSDEFPGILIEDRPDSSSRDLAVEGRGKIKKDTKKYAMIFPIIATFKFIAIKALLITILIAVFAIKKLIVVTIMALPVLLAMLRVCRGGFFSGFGPLTNAAPLTAAIGGPLGPLTPYSAATDAIVGDFSSYSHMTQSPYYARHDYGGRSYLPPMD